MLDNYIIYGLYMVSETTGWWNTVIFSAFGHYVFISLRDI